MSLDRSLKSKASLSRHRNVLTRAERIKVLSDEEKWKEEKGIFGLPKVPHRKAAISAKVKKEVKEGDAAAAGAPGAAPAAGAAAAPAADAKKGAAAKPEAKKPEAKKEKK